MTHLPKDFPWQVIGLILVTIVMFLGAVFSALCAVGRTLRDRRREDSRPGYVTDFWPAGSDSWFEEEGR